jgi:hypothetical protein
LALALKLSFESAGDVSWNFSIDDAFELVQQQQVPFDEWAIWISKQCGK